MENINDPIYRLVVSARVEMLLSMPFFGQLATRLVAVDASSWCKTAAVDGRHLFYNREFVKSLTKPELIFLLAHEVLHLVYDHLGRRGGRDPKIHNMATDYIINYTLKQEKIGEMPKMGLYNKDYTDEYTSEELYEILKKNSVEIKMPLDEHLELGDDSDPDDKKSGDSDGMVSITIMGKDGPPKLSEADLQEIRSELKAAVIQTVQGCGAGNVPAGVLRLIDNLLKPKLDWRSLLDTHIRSSVKDDYTFQKLSRRSWGGNFLLPAQDFMDTIEVYLRIDGSGSTTQEMITDFCSEAKGIMETFGDFRVNVATFDTEIYDEKVFTPENLDEIHEYARNFRGGGGTEFNAIYEQLKRDGVEPARLVILTDGEPNSTWGDPNYCDTLFIIHSNPRKEAPFGMTAHYESRD